MIDQKLKLARDTARLYADRLPIARHRLQVFKIDVAEAQRDVDFYEAALAKAQRIEGEIVLWVLTCGMSHRRALRVVQALNV